MPLPPIERPNGHEALSCFAGAVYSTIFADMAEFDHHRRFKWLVVCHGRKRKTADLVAKVARPLRPKVSSPNVTWKLAAQPADFIQCCIVVTERAS